MTSPSPFPPLSPADLEKYSSAITLSDMEIFVFPELLYPLVLANIMSPRIWAWRRDPWFASLPRLSPYRRILRLKQYIIDHYAFNLDLDTWGLTTQQRELDRFAPYLPPETIARSNALFGYEGDRFYFDLDIRRHFGLDKYTHDTIPYWKTETVEAMDAFRFRPGHPRGAGECVSLSTLYAAALYILCGIPLEDIFLVATPLHSQNFVDAADGILTNNRRLVTKPMWFNGTELSAKARRALEHEQITIVSHVTGYAHVVYPRATIDPAAYARFRDKLSAFVSAPFTPDLFANFLRQAPAAQTSFQLSTVRNGRLLHLPAETAYAYEASSPYKLSDSTRQKLLDAIDIDDFFPSPIPHRIPADDLAAAIAANPTLLDTAAGRATLADQFRACRVDLPPILDALQSFRHLTPRWPKTDLPPAAPAAPPREPPIDLPPGLTRQEIIDRLTALRPRSPTADLAFYAYRDITATDPAPFLKAALERSPVCAEATAHLTPDQLHSLLLALPSDSIYDDPDTPSAPPVRLAQPDEAWNAQRGDGLELALLLASVLRRRTPSLPLTLTLDRSAPATIRLTTPSRTYPFPSRSPLPPFSRPL